MDAGLRIFVARYINMWTHVRFSHGWFTEMVIALWSGIILKTICCSPFPQGLTENPYSGTDYQSGTKYVLLGPSQGFRMCHQTPIYTATFATISSNLLVGRLTHQNCVLVNQTISISFSLTFRSQVEVAGRSRR